MYFHIRSFLHSAARISLTATMVKCQQSYVHDEHVRKPIKLIALSEDGNLQLDEDAKQTLSRIPGNVTVITCLGKYRSGKSTILNKLYGVTNGGFQVGHTTNAQTKGVWVMTKPHPKKPEDTLVLLDTEGLYDAHHGNKHKDRKLFGIAVLCSSSIINNIQCVPGSGDIQDLVYVLHLAKDWMQDKDVEKTIVFPYLHFLVCNFQLKLERSPKEYLDDLLSSPDASVVTTKFKKRSLNTLCPLNEAQQFKAQFKDFKNAVIENAQEFRLGDITCGMNEWLIHVEELIKCQDSVPQIESDVKRIKDFINKRENDLAIDTFNTYLAKFSILDPCSKLETKSTEILKKCKERANDGCVRAQKHMEQKINEKKQEDRTSLAALTGYCAGAGLVTALELSVLAVFPVGFLGAVAGAYAAAWLSRKFSGKK